MGETTGKKRTYTVAEIREILGISRPAAYNLVKKNNFHSVRIGNQIRISKESFDQWLEGNRSQVGTDSLCREPLVMETSDDKENDKEKTDVETDLLLLLKLLQKPEMAALLKILAPEEKLFPRLQ